MNAVIFYSNTGESESVARYLAQKLDYPAIPIEEAEEIFYQNLVLVFPVYCQNIPDAVKNFLSATEAEHFSAVATYGKMCYGNVLHEIQHKYRKNIVAGAYVPTKHSYIENDDTFHDFERLLPLVEKIQNPSDIKIPRSYKNPLANLFPLTRSRLGLKIIKTSDCDGCGACAAHCALGAMQSGVPGRRCIRCLKCVSVCPRHALKIKLSLPLRLYLARKKTEETVIYV